MKMPSTFGPIEIFEGKKGQALLYCTTAKSAFGPMFQSVSEAKAFCGWLEQNRRVDLRRNPELSGNDPRHFTDPTLNALLLQFRKLQET
jgi:hypothetical protein